MQPTRSYSIACAQWQADEKREANGRQRKSSHKYDSTAAISLMAAFHIAENFYASEISHGGR